MVAFVVLWGSIILYTPICYTSLPFYCKYSLCVDYKQSFNKTLSYTREVTEHECKQTERP